MNKQLENPFLKQLVSNIASKANQGRITNLTWGTLAEARKKKSVKEGNMAPKKTKPAPTEEDPADEKPADDVGPAGSPPPKGNPDLGADTGSEGGGEEDAGGLPDLGGGGLGDLGGTDAGGAPDSTGGLDADVPPEEDAGEVQADATAAKAELEKAKAEKDQAEKEIKKQSHVNLVSSSGVHFLLGKLVDHAFKTNTIDSLAAEMTGKLKIQTPEDFSNFSEEISPFRSIPGVSELLAAMKGMAGKQPDTAEEIA